MAVVLVRRIRYVAARRGLETVRAARLDAERLELPDASIDVALCALGLMYVPEPLVALQEMRRVLVDGGRAVVAMLRLVRE